MSVVVRTHALGNLADFPIGARAIERIAVRSDDLARRIVRLATSIGDIGLRFDDAPLALRLRDGDVVYVDDRLVIAVTLEPDDVLVFTPPTMAAAIALAHALGNRHLPIQADGEAIVVRYDPLLAALGAEHGVAVRREARVLPAPFRHAHAPHAHD